MNLTLKSGTGHFHGTAYEFLRNNDLDAHNFFDAPNTKVPERRHNQFGFSLGGPVKKDKLFFFADYEGRRFIDAQTYVNTVPSPAQLTGDFTGLSPIYDPQTYNASANTRQQFPGNIIPASRVNAVSSNIAALYPSANLSSKLNNFVYNPNMTNRGDQFDIKADDYLSSKDNLSLRYSYGYYSRFAPPQFPGHAGGSGYLYSSTDNLPSHQVSLTETHIFTPTLVDTLRLAFTRFTINDVPLDFGANLSAKAGIPGVNVTPNATGLTGLTISGYGTLGSAYFSPATLIQNNYQVQENISWNHSSHTIKAGVDINRRQLNFFQITFPNGQMGFDTSFSNQPASPTGTGDGFASFLLGIPTSGTISRLLTGPYSQRYTETGAFVKDDWKVRSNVTVNLGVRYELFTPLTEAYNRMSNFDPTTGHVVLAGTSGWPQGLVNADSHDFGPRVGIAWSPGNSRRLSIHAGGGYFYDVEASAGGKRLSENPPFLVTPGFANSVSAITNTIDQGFPANINFNPASPSGIALIEWDRNMKHGQVLEWNLTAEEELAHNLVFKATYAASRGDRMLFALNDNQARPGAGAVGARRPYPQILDITALKSIGNSTYQSLQMQLERRFARGVSFVSGLTLGKAIDDCEGVFGDNNGYGSPATANNDLNLRAQKGLSDFHVGKRWVNNFQWALPFGRGMALGSNWNPVLNAVLGGWQLNGILSMQDGLPFTPQSADVTNGSGAYLPNRIGNGNLPGDQRTLQHWYDKSAFALPATYTFGNSGRNVLFAPGLVNLDCSAFKKVDIRESYHLEYRAEFFNATNTPYFGVPGTRVDLATGATITSAQPGRIIQMGLKLRF